MRTETDLRLHLVKSGAEIADEFFDGDGFIGVKGCLKWGGTVFTFIASNGEGWEHVSVSTPNRCPTWDEMNRFKQLFWPMTECVMQLHPPEDNYVNNHPYCLHLWRPIGVEIPQPPTNLVGIKS